MKAMILAAGRGTRLGRITQSIPKALVDINGKSVLQIAIEKCTASGFDDIIINVHHFADLVEIEIERLRKKGFRLTVSDERNLLLDTGGGLYKAKGFFDKDPFLLYNADIITDLDLNSLFEFHRKCKGLATLAVRNRKGNRYFLINKEGKLSGWCNKTTGEKIFTGRIGDELTEIAFSGIHVIDPDIFDYMSDGIFTMTALYLQLASEHNIFTFRVDEGYWYDIGTPENLKFVRSVLVNNSSNL